MRASLRELMIYYEVYFGTLVSVLQCCSGDKIELRTLFNLLVLTKLRAWRLKRTSG